MAKKEFNAGDLVQLKSGGPIMTVDATPELGYWCAWFSGTKHNRAHFADDSLNAAEPPKEQEIKK